jgi:hypothetical protein
MENGGIRIEMKERKIIQGVGIENSQLLEQLLQTLKREYVKRDRILPLIEEVSYELGRYQNIG